MAIDKYVKPGTKLDIRAVKRTSLKDNQDSKLYTTKVYDVLSDDQIEVIMPSEQSKLILLPVDGEFQLFFYSDNGLYECVARVIDRYKSNNIYILLFELETNLKKFQRREYYRYNIVLGMASRKLEPHEIDSDGHILGDGELDESIPFDKSTIVDISGGGIRFVSRTPYQKGSYIVSKYSLPIRGRFKEYVLISRILEIRALEERRGGYEHRAQYINISNKDREEIIQFIFDEERKNRQKERGL